MGSRFGGLREWHHRTWARRLEMRFIILWKIPGASRSHGHTEPLERALGDAERY